MPAKAIKYLKDKGLKPSFSYEEVWKEEHNNAFTVAKMLETDLLRETHALLTDSIKSGKTYAQFVAELRPELIEKGWWGKRERTNPKTGKIEIVQLGSNHRLKTIYQTNMRQAYGAGHWQRIEKNKETHPYLVYELGASIEHRLEHSQWAGLTLPVDHKFWKTHYPQNGWGCHCRVRQVSKATYEKLLKKGLTIREQELDKNGLPTGRFTKKKIAIKTKAPKIEKREVLNKHTGEIMAVPKGIDAGFDYNPGLTTDRTKSLATQLETKEKALAKAVDAPLDTRQIQPVFSSAKNVTTAKLNQCLRALPDAQEQVDQLFEFMDKKKTQSLFLKSSEIGWRNKASRAIQPKINGYLNKTGSGWSYIHRKPTHAGGVTSVDWEHVVVKVKSTTNLNRSLKNIAQYKKGVAQIIDQQPSCPYSVSSMFSGNDSPLTTFLHEIGHQIHYYAGAPSIPDGAKSFTRYGDNNKMEYHAEHFAAWLLNRQALYDYDPVSAMHIDDIVKTAITSKIKRR